MKFEKFTNGYVFTLGAELELRILNADDYSCANEYEYFKENVSQKYKDNITPEFLKSMLEINTPVYNNIQDLMTYVKDIIEELNSLAKAKNLVLQASGTSVLPQENLELSSVQRYEELSNEHKILLDDFSICGLHVHVGFKNFDKALKGFNYSLVYLPLFVALSASSVFSNGIDTGIHSYRTKIFDRLPKASIPEYFTSYNHMKKVLDTLYFTDVIKSEKDVWWDVRIQPHFKTIEFRVCDSINDFDRLEVIIGLCQIIAKLSQDNEIIYEPMQVLKQNMWKASRYSMDADFIYNNSKTTIRKVMLNLLNEAREKGYIDDNFIQKAKDVILKDSISKEMINIYDKTKNLKDVVKVGVFK